MYICRFCALLKHFVPLQKMISEEALNAIKSLDWIKIWTWQNILGLVEGQGKIYQFFVLTKKNKYQHSIQHPAILQLGIKYSYIIRFAFRCKNIYSFTNFLWLKMTILFFLLIDINFFVPTTCHNAGSLNYFL